MDGRGFAVYVCVRMFMYICIYVYVYIYMYVYAYTPAVSATLWHCHSWAALLWLCCIAAVVLLAAGVLLAIVVLLAAVALYCCCYARLAPFPCILTVVLLLGLVSLIYSFSCVPASLLQCCVHVFDTASRFS